MITFAKLIYGLNDSYHLKKNMRTGLKLQMKGWFKEN